MAGDVSVQIAPWKYDASFVYSMTYDEATIDAIVNSYPIHQEHGIPGHVCAVSGYLGTQRLERGTSMREVFHMSAEQLRFLLDRGWTVSSHSHSHPPTNLEAVDLDLEVRLSKWELEQATGRPVMIFTIWNNLALADQIVPAAQNAGYLGVLSIAHPFNPPDYDVWAIGRGTIGRDLEGWLTEPTASAYRHTRAAFPGRLTREATRGTWLVDLTHIVADRHPRACPPSLWNRCSTPAIVDARLREVRALWGDDLWATVPEDVLQYTLLRRAARLEVSTPAPDQAECLVRLGPLPAAMESRALTFRAELPWRRATVAYASNTPPPNARIESRMIENVFTWTASVEDGTRFVLCAG